MEVVKSNSHVYRSMYGLREQRHLATELENEHIVWILIIDHHCTSSSVDELTLDELQNQEYDKLLFGLKRR